MKQLITLILLFCSLAAWADLNVFDLVREGKISYPINSTCALFFKTEKNRKAVVTDAFQKEIQSLGDLGFDPYYFHYTDSSIPGTLLKSDIQERRKAQVEILKEQGYESILNHQMTYPGALENVAGTGIYLAANPFSSADYGGKQIMFKLNQSAKVFDTTVKAKRDLYDAEMKRLSTSGYLSHCPQRLIMSLLMDENGVDIWYYNSGRQWMSVFNEDIFEESRFLDIGIASSTLIANRMADAGEIAPLLESVKEFGGTKYSIPLSRILPYLGDDAENNLLEALLKIIPYKGNENIFASILTNPNNSTFHTDYARLKSLDRGLDKRILLKSIKDVNPDFKDHYVDLILAGKQASNKELLKENLHYLVQNDAIQASDFFQVAKAQLDFDSILKDYRNRLYRKGIAPMLMFEILENRPDIFQGFLDTAKYSFFNYFMLHGDLAQMSRFVSGMESQGFDIQKSFEYVKTNSTRYNSNGAAAFLTEMARRSPELLKDKQEARKILNVQRRAKIMDSSTALFLLENRDQYRESWDAYYSGLYLTHRSELANWVNTTRHARLLNDKQKEQIFKEIFNTKGAGSQEYASFVANSNMEDKEYDLLIGNKQLNAQDRLALIGRFSKSPIHAKRFANIPQEDSVWAFFNGSGEDKEVEDKIIELYEASLVHYGDSLPAHAGAYAYEKLAKIERLRRHLNRLSDRIKVVYLLNNEQTYKDPMEYRPIYSSIKLDQAIASKILNYASSLEGERSLDFTKTVLIRPDIIEFADKESFDAFTSNIVNQGQNAIELLKQALNRTHLSYEKALCALVHLGDKDSDAVEILLGAHLGENALATDELDALDRAYEKNYGSKKYFKDAYWSRYKSRIESHDIAIEGLQLSELDKSHLDFIIRDYFSSNEEHVRLKRILEQKGAGENIYSLAAKLEDDSLLEKVLGYVTGDYPATSEHIEPFMAYYLNNMPDWMEGHIKKQLCEKVDGFKGLKEWYKSAEGDERKSRKRFWIEKCDVAWPYW